MSDKNKPLTPAKRGTVNDFKNTVSYHLSIITPQGKFFEDDVEFLSAPGKEGVFNVLAKHMPIISLLTKGTLRIKTNGIEQSFPLTQGILELNVQDQVLILLDSHPNQ